MREFIYSQKIDIDDETLKNIVGGSIVGTLIGKALYHASKSYGNLVSSQNLYKSPING
ncbi:hypothetical protein [Companilactobacillus sp. HBUAS56257]|jgi:hypothetical protein|uniref:hypothetical protein n=1 Tax=Companilactobacillus sp. HBUAS56257 TaxID=3109360 RepID=UPI002FF41B3E